MTFASFSTVPIVSGAVAIPVYGMWTADLLFPGEQPVDLNGNLVIGNLTMRGHVYRQSLFVGSRRCRIVGGYGGWYTTIPGKQYVLSSGVPLSMVLGDAADECGEQVNVGLDRIVGPMYVRAAGLASDVLRSQAGSNWYVDNAGVTQIDAWPSRSVATPFDVIDQNGAEGQIEIATEDYASWMPRCTFTARTLEGTYTNGGIVYTFDDSGKFRMHIMTMGGTS